MRKIFTLWLLSAAFAVSLFSQEYEYDEFRLTPEDSLLIERARKKDTVPTWEFGVTGGHVFHIGNVDYLPGVGGGVHFRRALDYVFSVRSDIFYAKIKGEDKANIRSFNTDWISASLLGLVSLNNLKWEKAARKTNLYVLGGLGMNYFESDVGDADSGDRSVGGKAVWHSELGLGISFRLGKKANFGLEHKVLTPFGARADLVDGFETVAVDGNRRNFSDIIHFSGVRINFNISKSVHEEEPKYWLNLLGEVYADLDSIKAILNQLEDTDGDGVVDLIDREPNTAAGAYVDTKGVTRDGDLDGIPDFLDREPYSPPGVPIDAYGVAKEKTESEEANVRAIVQEEIAKIEFPELPPPVIETKTSNWYLPNIYFEAGSTELTSLDHGTILTISKVMRENPEEKFVIAGHTDKAGSEKANNRLSYKRATSVLSQLVNYGVPREQLILMYEGEKNTLMDGLHKVNRRVEIRRAKGESEMAPPE